ncbi:MAG TPA: autotransporter-associated beta strand repeat-containing protein, partial [Candidatus Anammoximicrobium sp.]|nr:autotransporter-associated beta strand repeat-containing protein [Candidatus Anammoximicrobium sp.]
MPPTAAVGGTNTSGTAEFTGPVVANKHTTLTAAAGGAVSFHTGVISGTGPISKTGDGTVILGGDNSYSGSTWIDAGTVIVTQNIALGAVTAGTTVADGATLAFAGNVDYTATERVTGRGSGADGLGVIQNAGGNNRFAGPVTLSAASRIGNPVAGTTLTLTGPIVMPSLNTLTFSGDGDFHVTGDLGGTPDALEQRWYATTGVARSEAFIDDMGNGANGGLLAHTPVKGSNLRTGPLDFDDLAAFNRAAVLADNADTDPPFAGTAGVTSNGEDFAFLWTGLFTAPASGTYTFKVGNSSSGVDDEMSFLIDLNDNGIFENATERVATTVGVGCCGNGTSVPQTLTAGEVHQIAIGFHEWAGGEKGSATFQIAGHPVFGDDTTVNPGAADQAGLWATPSMSVVKAGPGTLRLSGSNTYIGTTTVSAGTLLVDGDSSAATGAVTVQNGATLGGTGTIGGPVAMNDTSTLGAGSPVSGTESLATGALTLGGATAFDVQINGTAQGATSGGYDLVAVSGTAALGGATLNLTGSYTPVPGNTFTILTSTGAVSGTFTRPGSGVPINDGDTILLNGQPLEVDYQTNAVVLTYDTSPALNADELTANPPNIHNQILVQRDASGTNVEVYIDDLVTPVFSTPLTGLTGLTINGQTGNDTLTVDFDNGDLVNSIGTLPITFNGNDPTTADPPGVLGAPGDSLVLANGSFQDVTYNYLNLHDGDIVLDPDGPGGDAASKIIYTGLEPIAGSTITAANVILNYGAASETISVYDAGSGQTTVNSTAGETTTFANPSQSLTINAGGGDDTIRVNSLASGYASLTLDGQDGPGDTVQLNGPLTLGGLSAGNLSVTSDTIRLRAAINTTGGSQGDVTFNGAVILQTGLLAVPTGIYGAWLLDETGGTLAPNLASGGTVGVLNNGPVWYTDPVRGQVLSFDGSDDWVDAGSIPALDDATSNFSWSFWTYQEQGANNDVALGNRYDAGSASGTNWIKFTPSRFEYVWSGTANGIDYTDIPQGEWVHHAVIKSGTSLTYYRNGQTGTGAGWQSTVTGDVPSRPFYIGGDKFAESWQGRIDDVALWNRALSQAEVQAAAGMAGTILISGRNVSFNGTVDAAAGTSMDLSVTASGNTTYLAPVGDTTPLRNLDTTSGGQTLLSGDSVTTTEDQTYVGPVVLQTSLLAASTGLYAAWLLDEATGTLANNAAPGGVEGLLYNGGSAGVNGPAWVNDPQRGTVLSFDGSDDWVDAGTIPALAAATSNFTWSFWTYQVQGANNDVALGNRWDAGGGTNTWIKFTANAFEYPGAFIDYANIPQGAWTHHAVVKSGNSLTYYRNGVTGGGAGWQSTVTADVPSRPFYIGGDKYGERWQGRIDDVGLWTRALTPQEIQVLAEVSGTVWLTGRNVQFDDTVDATGGVAMDLVVTAGNDTRFAEDLGGINPLRNLTVTSGNQTLLEGVQVTTSGDQEYNGPVTLDTGVSPTTVALNGDDVRFAGTVDAAASVSVDLTIAAAGDTAFEGQVGQLEPVRNLTVTSGGQTFISGGSVTTVEDQTYNGPVVLQTGVLAVPTGLYGAWLLDETSGSVAPNTAPGGAPGTLYNGPAWYADAARGQVLRFDGNDDWVDAGSLPALDDATSDFTWSFWTYQEQGTNSDVALGNRFAAGGGGSSWIKFTPNAFEYVWSWNFNNIDYVDIAQNAWVHHAVVKSGTSLTYYRDGQTGAGAGWQATVTGDMPSLPFYLGGDKFGERWQGRIDDVGLWARALTQQEIQAAAGLAGAVALTGQDVHFRDTLDAASGASVDLTVAASGVTLFDDAVGGVQPLASLTVTTGDVTATDIGLSAGGSLSVTNTGAASTISGTISGSGATLAKAGSGTLTLSGPSTYTGTTTVSEGTLLVNGNNGAATGAVSVAAGAVLGGNGTIGGAVSGTGTVAPGASFSPRSTAVLNVNNPDGVDLTGATFQTQINGVTAGGLYDQLSVIGPVTLGGTATLDLTGSSFAPSPGTLQSVTLIANDDVDLVTGTFAGLAEGSPVPGVPSGTWYITYAGGDGNDVVLNSQPIVNGTNGQNDTLVLYLDAGGNLEFILNGAPAVDLGSVGALPNFTFNGLDGHDLMTVDLAAGLPAPAGGVFFNGGTNILQANPDPTGNNVGDALRVLGTGAETATYLANAVTTGNGTVTVGSEPITFTGVDSLDSVTPSVELTNFLVANVGFPNGQETLALAAAPDVTQSALTNTLGVSGTSGTTGLAPVALQTIATANIDTTGNDGVDQLTILSADNAHGITDLRLTTGGNGDQVIFNGAVRVPGTVTISSTDAAVTDNLPDSVVDITAAALTVTAGTFGASGNDLDTSVDFLSIATWATGGSQFINELTGLSGLDLNAGTGNVSLLLTEGPVGDADADPDIRATAAVVTLADADDSGDDFGSSLNPIGTGVSDLSVDTSAGANDGSQWIAEADDLSELDLNAGVGGDIQLAVGGGIASADAAADLSGDDLTVSAVTGIGAVGAALGTDVATLDAVNSTSGDLVINEVAAGLNLDVRRAAQDGGSGSIALSTERGNLTVLGTGLGVQLTNAANAAGTIWLDANVTVPANDEPLPRGDVVVNQVVTSQGGAISITADHDVTGEATGVITSNGGTITITADANGGGPGGNDNGTIQLRGDIVAGLGAGTVTLSLADCDGWLGATTGTGDGEILSALDIIKNGLGALRLNGASNNYTGQTTINDGTLIVNGTLTDSTPAVGGVVVTDNALLGGGDGVTTGTINADITVQAGGILDPGDLNPADCSDPNPGQLTVTGNIAMAVGATFRVQLNGLVPGSQYDQLVLHGLIDIAGNDFGDPAAGANLDVTAGYGMPFGGEHTIIVYDPGDLIDQRFRDPDNGGATLHEGGFFSSGGTSNLLNISYYTKSHANDVTLTHPGRFDFNGYSQTTAPNYVGVPESQVKSGSNTFGWDAAIGSFVRPENYPPPHPTADPLLSDGHWVQQGTVRTFQVQVVRDRTYQVQILTGDWVHPRDWQQFRVYDPGPGGSGPIGDDQTKIVSTQADVTEYTTVRFEVTVGSSGLLYIEMQDLPNPVVGAETNPAAVILGMDIRPLEAVGLITLTRTEPAGSEALDADGLTVDTYRGTGAPPGTWVTVRARNGSDTANVGRITTADEDVYHTLTQVFVQPDGTFTFQFQRPTGIGPMDLTVETTPGTHVVPAAGVGQVLLADAFGLSRGTFQQGYTLPSTRLLDFNAGSAVTAAAYPNLAPELLRENYLGVPVGQTYDAVSTVSTNALGWNAAATGPTALPLTSFDRGGLDALLRDGHHGYDSEFLVDLPPAGSYIVNTVIGDTSPFYHDRV